MQLGPRLILAGYAGLVLQDLFPIPEIISGLFTLLLCASGIWILLRDDDDGPKRAAAIELRPARVET